MSGTDRRNGHSAYIAVAVCNFDDVILGVWRPSEPGRRAAINYAKRVHANPELRHKAEHQANDTCLLSVRVYLATGKTLLEVFNLECGGKLNEAVAEHGA